MSKKATFKSSFGLFVVAAGLVLCVRWVLFEPFVIPSGSMIPSLLVNDHIVVSKFDFGLRRPFSKKWIRGPKSPQRGEVVVFKSVEKDNFYMVKRVIGLPGETIGYNSEGQILVNGEPIELYELSEEEFNAPDSYQVSEEDIGEPFSNLMLFNEHIGEKSHRVILSNSAYRWSEKEFVVPDGHIFLMGDNRDNSRDSRSWGSVPLENLVGKARRVWLSCDQTLSQLTFVCDPRHIRWQRLLYPIE